MKNKLTRKLMLSAFTLLFAVISLGASTYAWFTMSEKAEVEAFTADVKAGEGIEIAVTADGDASNVQWYTGVLESEIIQPIVNAKNVKFGALTTINAVEFYDQNDDPVTNSDNSASYLEFYLHIKSAESGSIKLSNITFNSKEPKELDEDNNMTYGAVSPWTADAGYKLSDDTEVKVNDEVLYEVANAARVALIVNNNTYIYENGEVEQPEGDVDYIFAGNTFGTTSTNGAYDYYNAKVSEAKQLDPNTSRKYVTNMDNDDENQFDEFDESIIEGQYITIKVVVWVEGWDAECLNAIFAQQLSIALEFELSQE